RPTRAVVRVAEPAAVPLLAHLQLLVVPPGVGIVLAMRSLAQDAQPVALAGGGALVLTLRVAGWRLRARLRWRHRRRGGPGAVAGGRGAGAEGPGAVAGGPGAVAEGPGAVAGGPGAAAGGPGAVAAGPGAVAGGPDSSSGHDPDGSSLDPGQAPA